MLEHDWAGRLRIRNRLGSSAYALFIVTLILALSLGTSAGSSLAQDDGTPSTGNGDSTVEQPAEPPADEPVDAPVEDEPVIDEPVDQQPTEPVDDSIDTDAGNPDEQAPTEAPTEIPTPTATAALPSLVVSEALTARCELAPAQPDAVTSGGTQQYDCQAEVGLAATAVQPGQVAIDWQVSVDTGGAWGAQLRMDDQHDWSEKASPPVLAAQSSLDEVVTAADGSGFVATESETFQLLITRPVCDTAPATLRVQISASSSLEGAVVAQSTLPEPLKIEPELAAMTRPTVIFAGPLNFGTVDADASGPAVSTLSGKLDVQLSGMNATCGSWQISISGAGMIDEDGQPLSGSTLLVLPVTEGGVACDVRDSCAVAQVAADPTAASSEIIPLALELRLGDAPVTGTFSTSLTVTITPLDAATADGNGA